MQHSFVLRIAWVALLSSSFAACVVPSGDASRSDFGDPEQVPLGPNCWQVRPCSITEEECQQSVLEVTACVRGREVPELPAVRIISRDEFRREREQALSSEMNGSPREDNLLHGALSALHLLAQDMPLSQLSIEHEIESVAAFYRNEQRDITVVSDGQADPEQAMTELSHELAHYLQDISGQLAVSIGPRTNTDEHLAREALTEGDAVLTSLRAAEEMRGLKLTQASWYKLCGALEQEVAERTNDAASPLLAALSGLPYALSLRALTAAWEAGGSQRVDSFFEDPPDHSLDWLSNEGVPGRRPRAALSCYPPRAPEGFELSRMDSLGMVGLYALLGTQDSASILSTQNLQDDVLAVYAEKNESASPRVLVVWRMMFSDERRAQDFATTLAPLGLVIAQFDNELSISASSDRELAPISGEALAECSAREELETALEASDSAAALRRFERAVSLDPEEY